MPISTTVFFSLRPNLPLSARRGASPVRDGSLLPMVKLSALNGVNSPELPYICFREQPFRLEKAGATGRDRAGPGKDKKRQDTMVRIFKFLLLLALIAFVGLVGYAYLGDMTPERSDVTVPVDLNVEN